MPYVTKVQDEPERSKYVIGFPKGLNTIQDKSLIHDKNLAEATNAVIVVDGLERRQGTTKVWDEGSASYVYGSRAYYNKVAGTRKYVRIGNSRFQYLDGTTWTDVGATSFADVETELVQARNRIYTYNGTDALRYYDGTSVTTFSTLATPTGLAVAPQGTAGSTAYSYRVTAFTSQGETAKSAAVAIANGNATLSSTNFNRVTYNTVANAEGYNIYGRKATGYKEVFLKTVYGASTLTYDDTGEDVPLPSVLPPDYNTTGGLIGTYAIFSRGRQWVAGVTEGSVKYPTRLYWSGTLDYIDCFVGGEYSGGWVEIDSNDGGEIVGLAPYQTGVIVFKDNGVYEAYFDSEGNINVKEVTKGHGGVSHRAIQVIDNDVIYVAQKDNKLEVYSIGYQKNYVMDQLRTNNISVYVSDSLSNVNRSQMSKIASFYWDNKFGFTYPHGTNTTNDRGYILDVRFGAWVKWTGLPMEASHYSIYDDGTNRKLYAGSNADGYMIELFDGTYNDDGAAYQTTIVTKLFSMGLYDVEKIFRNPTLWFKYIQGGSINAYVWIDGSQYSGTAVLSVSSGGVGFGADKFGEPKFGTMINSTPTTATYADIPIELSGLYFGRTLGLNIIDTNKNSNWRLMGIHVLFTPLAGKPLPQEFRFELT